MLDPGGISITAGGGMRVCSDSDAAFAYIDTRESVREHALVLVLRWTGDAQDRAFPVRLSAIVSHIDMRYTAGHDPKFPM
jgi:hypothetical protein